MVFRNTKGFTLPEVLISVAILAATVGITAQIFLSGQNTWFTSDAKIQMQESLRKALYRVGTELRQATGKRTFTDGSFCDVLDAPTACTPHIYVQSGAGVSGSDIVRFEMPVVCQSNAAYLNNAGDIAHWGAPLTWGCSAYTCMDANNDCGTVEYKFVEYRLNSSKQLVREVLDASLVVKRTDVIADNITGFQAAQTIDTQSTAATSDDVVIKITLTAAVQKQAANRRILTAQASLEVYLRN